MNSIVKGNLTACTSSSEKKKWLDVTQTTIVCNNMLDIYIFEILIK